MSVTSPKGLSQLREELAGLNQQLFRLFLQRSAVVTEIQRQKSASGKFSSYDACREMELFVSMRGELEKLGAEGRAAFSHVMQWQAGAPENYPDWLSGAHLSEFPHRPEQRTNPLLLKLFEPELFASLKLLPDFEFLRSM